MSGANLGVGGVCVPAACCLHSRFEGSLCVIQLRSVTGTVNQAHQSNKQVIWPSIDSSVTKEVFQASKSQSREHLIIISLAAHLASACCEVHCAAFELEFLAMYFTVRAIAMTCTCLVQQSGALDAHNARFTNVSAAHGVLFRKLPCVTPLSCHQHKHTRPKIR